MIAFSNTRPGQLGLCRTAMEGTTLSRSIVFAVVLLAASAAAASDYLAAVEQAKAAALAGDLQRARDTCAQVVQARPGPPAEPKAELLMGHILLKESAPITTTIDQFMRAASAFPDSPEAPEALLRVAYLRDKQGQDTTEWATIAEKYPDSREAAEALHCLGHLALRTNDPDAAIRKFDASAAHPLVDSVLAQDSLTEAGYACVSRYWQTAEMSMIKAAVERFTSARDKAADPELTMKAMLGLGESYLICGYSAQAVDTYSKLLALDPKDPFVRGVALVKVYACAQSFVQCRGAWPQITFVRAREITDKYTTEPSDLPDHFCEDCWEQGSYQLPDAPPCEMA